MSADISLYSVENQVTGLSEDLRATPCRVLRKDAIDFIAERWKLLPSCIREAIITLVDAGTNG